MLDYRKDKVMAELRKYKITEAEAIRILFGEEFLKKHLKHKGKE